MATVLPLPRKKPTVTPVLRTAARLLSELQPGQSAVINGLTWAGYDWIDKKRDEVRPKLKLAYHRGSLELMVVSFFHDGVSRRLEMVIRQACVALGFPLRAAGGMTVRREDVESGLEPDESFYIQNVPAVRGLKHLDFSIHPVPDLAIEVDVSRSSLSKQSIYASLGVPELWRFTGETVTFLVRTRKGTYRAQPNSRALPLVTSADVTRLVLAEPEADTALFRLLTEWANALKPTTK